MTPARHKNKLLRLITQLRDGVSECVDHKHLQNPYPAMQDFEDAAAKLIGEIERTVLLK